MKIEATEQEWDTVLQDLAKSANRSLKFARPIHRFVFEITRDLACNAPDCPFCLCRTPDEFADFMEAKNSAHAD